MRPALIPLLILVACSSDRSTSDEALRAVDAAAVARSDATATDVPTADAAGIPTADAADVPTADGGGQCTGKADCDGKFCCALLGGGTGCAPSLAQCALVLCEDSDDCSSVDPFCCPQGFCGGCD